METLSRNHRAVNWLALLHGQDRIAYQDVDIYEDTGNVFATVSHRGFGVYMNKGSFLLRHLINPHLGSISCYLLLDWWASNNHLEITLCIYLFSLLDIPPRWWIHEKHVRLLDIFLYSFMHLLIDWLIGWWMDGLIHRLIEFSLMMYSFVYVHSIITNY